MKTRFLASLILAALCGLATASAADWPRFRGPNGTGVAADKDVPVQWDDKENLLWKTPIPGRGNSSPIVSGDNVFVQSAAADGSERWLFCLNAANGEVRWKKTAPGAAAKTHPKNTLASSTPAADGERVYAVFWDGKDVSLVAYDFKGEQQWKRDLGGFTSEHGAGMSPIVYDGKVVLNFDQDKSAAVWAFDAKSGKDAWKTERKGFRTCYSTPFVLEKDKGEAEIIVSSTAGVAGYNPADGSPNWTYTWTFARDPLRVVGSPIAVGDLLVANSGAGSTGERDTIAIRLGGKGELNDKSLVWQVRKSFPYVPSLLAKGDHVFSVNDAGTAACYDAKTGEEVWNKRLNSAMSASPVLIDGKVYAAGEDGEVYVFEAATTYKLLAKNDVGEAVFATPAVSNNRLFIRGKDNLFCIAKSAKSAGQ